MDRWTLTFLDAVAGFDESVDVFLTSRSVFRRVNPASRVRGLWTIFIFFLFSDSETLPKTHSLHPAPPHLLVFINRLPGCVSGFRHLALHRFVGEGPSSDSVALCSDTVSPRQLFHQRVDSKTLMTVYLMCWSLIPKKSLESAGRAASLVPPLLFPIPVGLFLFKLPFTPTFWSLFFIPDTRGAASQD